MDGTFTAVPLATATGLGVVTGLAAADIDGDGELDLAVAGTDRVTVLRNRPDPAPQTVLSNGDFAQGLGELHHGREASAEHRSGPSPTSCIDSVITHKFYHLKVRNHNRAFYAPCSVSARRSRRGDWPSNGDFMQA